MKRILITGASGMLGSTLVEIFSGCGFTVYATGADKEVDIPNYKFYNLACEDYSELINWSNPEVIIHCAAIINGNYCSEHPKEAFDINGISLKKIVEATDNSVKIIYISTDAVFPSDTHLATEEDSILPESIYGKSKEIGEFFLRNTDRDYTIVRTTIVGLNKDSAKIGFVEWILQSAIQKEEVGLFDDVLFTPITIWNLAEELMFLATNSLPSKIYHITGSEILSKYEFGKSLLDALGIPMENIAKDSILRFDDRAKRSTDQTLSVNLYQEHSKRVLPNNEKTIQTLVSKIQENEKYQIRK
ncbi:SDR family oxidoreductase [Labilibaculum sp. DW002]|uniref:dTDP-4-dehydrorhamnose reductase n=1 Tax=Paralabilibaculum antarcticum TaxID=2912572 RepID=A0ABT5VP65_9BACT|nr:SDR family oxidoreductase [Labilibaculum sp. DW002]MDE5417229.1 SDR family oxidoreductase [Labilibaculum sp. DW002]